MSLQLAKNWITYLKSTVGSGTTNSGTAGRIALYPTTADVVDDTYIQNTKNIEIGIGAQPTRSQHLAISVPNPGDAVTAADVLLSEGDQTINGVKTFGSQQVDTRKTDTANGGSGNWTSNWNEGNWHYIVLITNTAGTMTLNNPVIGAHYILELKQPAAGVAATVVWPGDVEWGTVGAPTLSLTNGLTDIIDFYYNGSHYIASARLGFNI